MSADKYPRIFSRQMATSVYIFPNFLNCTGYVKDLKDNKDNSRHLARKYAQIFVLGHYLFLVAHSFPRASLSENCSFLGTDNVRGQISENIFAPNSDYCLYIFAPNTGYCLYLVCIIKPKIAFHVTNLHINYFVSEAYHLELGDVVPIIYIRCFMSVYVEKEGGYDVYVQTYDGTVAVPLIF